VIFPALLAAALAGFAGQASLPAAVPQTSAPVVFQNQDQTNLQSASSAKKPNPTASGPEVTTGEPMRQDNVRRQRNAAKLYLKGVHLLEKQQLAEAWALLKQAAELEPENPAYIHTAEVARQGRLAQLVRQSTQQSLHGDGQGAVETLKEALEIDPKNEAALQRLNQLGDQESRIQIGTQANLTMSPPTQVAAGPIVLEPSAGKHSFHLNTNQYQAIKEVFKAYGITVDIHDSVQNKQVRIEAENATFPQAMRLLSLMTNTFYEPLDPHRVIVARETRENRTQLQRLQMETVQLPGLTAAELTEVSNLARNVFDAQQSAAEPSTGTLTVRAPGKTLEAFNQTVTRLIQGRAQLDLDVKIIQVALVHNRETGTTFFQQTGVYNAYSEINSVIQQNQSAVQQIIAAGLVPNDTTLNNQLTIIGILLAAGTLTGPPFNQGLIGFGNGITGSILAVSPATLTMTLNSSDTRELDDVHLSLADQEDGTIKTGERYPIESSSYSSVAIAAAATAGLSSQTIPQIQYEDLGLTLKATPKIMRSGDIALKFSLKIEALGGSSLNDIPVLDNRSMEGVLTLREGDTAVLLSDLTRQESRALSGLPGVSDIPGLQEISDIQKDQSYSRLLIMVTPSVTRETNQGSHSPIFMVDKSTTSR